jgi:mono/diheme cytochrome c family protein
MQDMYDQPKYEPLEASLLFADNLSSRKPIPGTIAQSSGAFADASSGHVGTPVAIGMQGARALLPAEVLGRIGTLRRGQERYNIYCSPCHSRAGDGHGMVVMRGFPQPPSYHSDALRHAPLSHFYDVITHGYGIMYSYADRVPPHDRWAIAAYIRALQLNQHAPLEDLPISVRRNRAQPRQ